MGLDVNGIKFLMLAKENGFYIEKAIIFESIPNTQWYEVTDPKNISKLTHELLFRL